MKSFMIFLMTLVVYILQTALFNQISILGVHPEIGIAFIVTLGLLDGMFFGGVTGLFYGALIGLVFSVTRLEMFFMAFEYAAVGVLAGYFVDHVSNAPWIKAVIFAFLGYLVKEVINIIPMLILKIHVSFGPFVLRVLLGALFTAVLMIGMHFLMVRIHRFRFMRAQEDDRIFVR